MIEEEVVKLQQKGPSYSQRAGICLTMFLAPKEFGQMKPVVNLKLLNRLLPRVIPLQKGKCACGAQSPAKGRLAWVCRIDLRDTYHGRSQDPGKECSTTKVVHWLGLNFEVE